MRNIQENTWENIYYAAFNKSPHDIKPSHVIERTSVTKTCNRHLNKSNTKNNYRIFEIKNTV